LQTANHVREGRIAKAASISSLVAGGKRRRARWACNSLLRVPEPTLSPSDDPERGPVAAGSRHAQIIARRGDLEKGGLAARRRQRAPVGGERGARAAATLGNKRANGVRSLDVSCGSVTIGRS
jgi:hypothetical protein